MKKNSKLTRLVVVTSSFVLFVALLSAVALMNVSTVLVLAGGLLFAAVVGLVCSDYSRKPRFRVRSEGPARDPNETPAVTYAANVICDWTYTTLGA